MTSEKAQIVPESAFQHLLVPLDGSQLAEAVLPVVREFARRCAARVTLLHVLERDAPATVHGERHLTDAAGATAYLTAVASQLAGEGLVADTHVHPNLQRDVAASLVDHALDLGSDLIVLATHGTGGLRGIVVGSIAEQTLRRGKAPVLLVRPESAASAGPFVVRRLLVPLDGTPDSELALPLAEVVARTWRAELVLLRVVPTRGSLPGDQAAVAVMLPSATDAILSIEQAAAEEYLRRLSAELARRGLAASPEVLRGDPTAVVLEEARRLGVDLVVMATHGRSGLDAFWSGSIGHRLSERLTIPLLTLRSERSS